MSVLDIFDTPEFAAAKSSQGGNYFKAGVHTARLTRIEMGESRKGEAMFIVESEIVESTIHQVGETVAWMALNRWEKAQFFGNVKGFIAGVMGIEESQVDLAAIKMVTSEEQPLAGELVRVNAFCKEGKDFINVRFSKLEE